LIASNSAELFVIGCFSENSICTDQEESMCDYSLHNVASREAKVGDKLQTSKFPYTTTIGFCAASEPGVAVCLRPGTEVSFNQDVCHWRRFSFFPLRAFGYETISHRVARFRQVNLERPGAHRDALEFSDGTILLVTDLKPGQRVTVLQLPAEPIGNGRDTEGVANSITSEFVSASES
jgi:hypothetical protein